MNSTETMRARLARRLHRWVDVYVTPLPEALPFIACEPGRLVKSKRRLVLQLEKQFGHRSTQSNKNQ